MDANQTRFHLLLGKSDWSRCADESGRTLAEGWAGSPPERESLLAWDDLRHELLLQPRLFEFPAQKLPSGSPPEEVPGLRAPRLNDRRGAARDRFGNWYWIDETRQGIVIRSAGSTRRSVFWPPAATTTHHAVEAGAFATSNQPPACPPLLLAGLAITEDHYLVVGVIEPQGFLCFDLHAGGAPVLRRWPAEVDFEPFDFARRYGGGFFALDRTHRHVWELDRHFAVIAPPPAAASPPDGEETEAFTSLGTSRRTVNHCSRRIRKTDALPVNTADPVAIEALPDGSVLVLDGDDGQGFASVLRYHEGVLCGAASARGMLELLESTRRAGLSLIGHDFTALPGKTAPALRQRLTFISCQTWGTRCSSLIFVMMRIQ